MKKFLMGSLLIASTFLGGCMATHMKAMDAEYPISLSSKPRGTYVKPFKVELKSHHFIFGLFNLAGDPDVTKAVDTEVKRAGGRGVMNLRMTTVNTFGDMILPGLVVAGGSFVLNASDATRPFIGVLGLLPAIWSQNSLIVEGDIIK